MSSVVSSAAADSPAEKSPPTITRTSQHTVEIVSDSGEGAQKCGQIFGTVSAKMGNGVWTVEIIPAEIQPPARDIDGASGNRIRIGSGPITNWGDQANIVVAFNEQALLGRHRVDALADDAVIFMENMWADHPDADVREQWTAAMQELREKPYRIIEIPMEKLCLTLVENPTLGKNMFVLGMLAWIYNLNHDLVCEQIALTFKGKAKAIYDANVGLLDLGMKWASDNVDFRIEVPPQLATDQQMVVMNGNQAIALGAVASGMELAAMYPITPATSASHYLAEMFEKFGGVVHQAEDEIAAAGVAIGASYSGKVAFTITSGPGLALKTEFLGLAVMAEIPLVLIDVQRGGPATGLPTKVEQSDLFAALFGQPGDTPHIVMAPSTIEDCFHVMITARKLAETFRTLVVVLSDANLATGVQPFPRPELDPAWFAPAIDLSAVPEGTKPFDWDPQTGLSQRILPGQPGGMHTLTGLSHDERGVIAYTTDVHTRSTKMRSRKMAVLQQTLQTPEVNGDASGDLLIVGWGSTKGAIEEAVERARAQGKSVSSLHLTFISPLPSGLKEIFQRFKKVMTVEINYSDEPGDPYITEENRRRGQLCFLLRASTLVDVDCWTRVPGEPLRPGAIHEAILANLPKGAVR